jgi:glycosyltransferase involved in cell wall biosynthesis
LFVSLALRTYGNSLDTSVSAGRRVLILVENLSVPFDRRVWQESLALKEAGYEVVVVCPRGETQDTERYEVIGGIEIYRYSLRTAQRGFGYVREYITALGRSLALALRLGRFDIVHACNPPDLLFLVALPFKLRGAKFVFDQHDLVPELYLSRFGRRRDLMYRALVMLERCTYRLADVVLATNDSYRRTSISRGRKAPERVFVVRSAPALDRFTRTDPDPGLRRGRRHLLCYLGVMGPQDGVDYALRALARLRDDVGRTDWHAAFIGSGNAYDSMVSLSQELKLDDAVTFTGRLSDDDVRRYLSTADVCLAPDPRNPLNDLSTMNKILEYMAMSRPIVSFDLREARVSAGEAAVYASPNDENEFARLIDRLLDDPAERERRGKAGRRRLESALSWELSRKALLESYSYALAGR